MDAGASQAERTSRAERSRRSAVVMASLAAILAAAIFSFDTMRQEPFTVAVLYSVVILMSVDLLNRRGVLGVAAGCALLTVLSFGLDHGGELSGGAVVRCLVSLAANAITTFLAVRSQTAAAALARSRDAAEAANRSKSEFLANMSHEIRTPLNGVLGVASVLALTELTPRQRGMVDIVLTSGRTLQSLLADILDMARIESGRIVILNEPIDLRRALEEVWALSRVQAEEKGLGGTLQIDPEVPGRILGDETRIKQVLGNLLGNAVKFTEAGEVSLRVTLETDAEGARIAFVVSDTGIGIAPDVLPQLFQRFAQANGGITRRFGGSGLGLAISRTLAELMGGTIDVTSAVGFGSRFQLCLPVAALEAPKPVREPPLATSPAKKPKAKTGSVQILLAEDNFTNAKVVNLILESIGVEPVWVQNGQEALDRTATDLFDLILMDMQMPVMDGLAAIRAIRARTEAVTPYDVPIVVLSANVMPDDVALSLAAGADAHLGKPLSASELLIAIENVLGARMANHRAAA